MLAGEENESQARVRFGLSGKFQRKWHADLLLQISRCRQQLARVLLMITYLQGTGKLKGKVGYGSGSNCSCLLSCAFPDVLALMCLHLIVW